MKRLWPASMVALRTAAVTYLAGFALGGVYGALLLIVSVLSDSPDDFQFAYCFVFLMFAGIGGSVS